MEYLKLHRIWKILFISKKKKKKKLPNKMVEKNPSRLVKLMLFIVETVVRSVRLHRKKWNLPGKRSSTGVDNPRVNWTLMPFPICLCEPVLTKWLLVDELTTLALSTQRTRNRRKLPEDQPKNTFKKTNSGNKKTGYIRTPRTFVVFSRCCTFNSIWF